MGGGGEGAGTMIKQRNCALYLDCGCERWKVTRSFVALDRQQARTLKTTEPTAGGRGMPYAYTPDLHPLPESGS